jgi:3-phosphoshikimate 1-carboxyvinyltransferase
MATGLSRLGVVVSESEDGLTIEGCGGNPLSGGNAPPTIAAELDHRIAMSFAIAGLNTSSGLIIDDMAPVATSFPTFETMLAGLAAA